MKTIELIVPCYNEEKCIALLCENVKKVFADMPEYDFIITYIDDGSKDSTLEEIKKVAAVENTGGGAYKVYITIAQFWKGSSYLCRFIQGSRRLCGTFGCRLTTSTGIIETNGCSHRRGV